MTDTTQAAGLTDEQNHYTVERHGNGWAIYTGRNNFHHGMNWGQLAECDESLARKIEHALNAYQPATLRGDAALAAQAVPDQDGEAFRQAAKLGLTLRFYGGCAQSSVPGSPSAYEVASGSDRAAAMREAIERASAVINGASPAPAEAKEEPKHASVDFLPHDDILRYACRVLSGDHPTAEDKAEAKRELMQLRQSIRPTPQPQTAQPVARLDDDEITLLCHSCDVVDTKPIHALIRAVEARYTAAPALTEEQVRDHLNKFLPEGSTGPAGGKWIAPRWLVHAIQALRSTQGGE